MVRRRFQPGGWGRLRSGHVLGRKLPLPVGKKPRPASWGSAWKNHIVLSLYPDTWRVPSKGARALGSVSLVMCHLPAAGEQGFLFPPCVSQHLGQSPTHYLLNK